MFDKLIDVILAFGNDLKWWVVIPVYNKALLLSGGKINKVLEPGFHWKWPFWDQPQEHTVVTTTFPIPVQSLITKDGKQIAVKAIAKYYINNIVEYVTEIYDATDALQDFTQEGIMLVLNSHTYEECRNIEDVSNEITKKVRAKVKKYGVYIEQITLTDLAETPSYRLFADGALYDAV